MSRHKRYVLIGSIAALIVGVESVEYRQSSRTACITVVNQANGPIEDLRLEADGGRTGLARLEVGERVNVYLTGRGKQTLKVSYQLEGSALTGFDVTGFNPAELSREAFKLVLVIRQDEWERYQDDAEPSRLASLAGRVQRWLEESFETP